MLARVVGMQVVSMGIIVHVAVRPASFQLRCVMLMCPRFQLFSAHRVRFSRRYGLGILAAVCCWIVLCLRALIALLRDSPSTALSRISAVYVFHKLFSIKSELRVQALSEIY